MSADDSDQGVFRYFRIDRVDMVLKPKRPGARLILCSTRRSNELFRRLYRASSTGEQVVYLQQDGHALDTESLAGLNSYLRTPHTMGRMLMPWAHLEESGIHRYAWKDFCRHLDLVFHA